MTDPTPTPSSPATPKPAAPPGTAASGKPTGADSLTIHGYSKIVFFWPTAAVSLIFFLISGGFWLEPLRPGEVAGNESNIALIHTLGLWWMIVFAFNLMVFTFDFGRSNFITFCVIVIAVALGITVLDVSFGGAWAGLGGFFGNLNIKLNSYFYLCIFVVIGFFLLLALIASRFDSWTLSSNELIHKHGFLGDVRAYSTIHMHVEKEIPDVFEYLLFGSGRLIFKPGNAATKRDEVLIVDNVFRINRAERKVKEFLGTLEVK